MASSTLSPPPILNNGETKEKEIIQKKKTKEKEEPQNHEKRNDNDKKPSPIRGYSCHATYCNCHTTASENRTKVNKVSKEVNHNPCYSDVYDRDDGGVKMTPGVQPFHQLRFHRTEEKEEEEN